MTTRRAGSATYFALEKPGPASKMNASVSVKGAVHERGHEEGSHLFRLGEVIDHVAHLLPAQGPITVFIHHNTLHAFEELPFTEAVKKGGRVFGCQPYLSEDRYREEL